MSSVILLEYDSQDTAGIFEFDEAHAGTSNFTT